MIHRALAIGHDGDMEPPAVALGDDSVHRRRNPVGMRGQRLAQIEPERVLPRLQAAFATLRPLEHTVTAPDDAELAYGVAALGVGRRDGYPGHAGDTPQTRFVCRP